MRGKAAIFACVGLALLAGGCDSTDMRYFRYGIGTDLYTPDIVATTEHQELYLAELCRQSSSVISPRGALCIDAAPSDWSLIVQAGMNDIDRRCDGYLAWLDDRRRTNSAVLKQIADTAFASQGLMRLAGLGADPITMVGLALGLATNTFTNINSRLLLEIDKTTVQTLVLHRRSDFRLEIANARFNHRPAAVHALRQYLTICTPFAIETEINATVTVFQQGGAGAIDRMGRLISPATVRAAVAAGTIESATKTGVKKLVPGGGLTHESVFWSQVRATLCVPPQPGGATAVTNTAIRDFLIGAGKLSAQAPADVTLGTRFRADLQQAGNVIIDCKNTKFLTAFEVGRYGMATDAARRADIGQLQTSLNVAVTGQFDDPTRLAITNFRTANSCNASLGGQVDRVLLLRIERGSALGAGGC